MVVSGGVTFHLEILSMAWLMSVTFAFRNLGNVLSFLVSISSEPSALSINLAPLEFSKMWFSHSSLGWKLTAKPSEARSSPPRVYRTTFAKGKSCLSWLARMSPFSFDVSMVRIVPLFGGIQVIFI